MLTKSQKKYLFSLIILAIICGVLWRAEVEYRGWAALTWISYFHYAVPAGFILFLLWANSTKSVSIQKRILINLVSIPFLFIVHIAFKTTLNHMFMSGPSMFLMTIISRTSELELFFIQYSVVPLLFLIPWGTYLILRIFKLHPELKYLRWSVAGMFLSIPASLLILKVTNHLGGPNVIHSIKSGIIIPFIVISFGLLFLKTKAQQS
jgi:hypothetical protein